MCVPKNPETFIAFIAFIAFMAFIAFIVFIVAFMACGMSETRKHRSVVLKTGREIYQTQKLRKPRLVSQ